MKIIFATTNNRKLEDLNNIITNNKLELEILSLNDIGWNLGEIEETGTTIEENSLIKAKTVLAFCKENNIHYPIITDDAGLFIDALNGEPGIYTARYADEEIQNNPELPKHYVVYKVLEKMKSQTNREAKYRCCVTILFDDGNYNQFVEATSGFISPEINEPIKKPYLYSLFIEKQTNMPFNQLSYDDLLKTYRFKALNKALNHLNKGKENYEKLERI